MFGTAFMHVPETAVDEHDGVVFRQYYIRVAGVTLVVLAESQTLAKQIAAYQYLDFGVFATKCDIVYERVPRSYFSTGCFLRFTHSRLP